MEKIIIRGGSVLNGTVKVDGAKNAALPMLVASLLATGSTTFEEVPPLDDVITICRLLEELAESGPIAG